MRPIDPRSRDPRVDARTENKNSFQVDVWRESCGNLAPCKTWLVQRSLRVLVPCFMGYRLLDTPGEAHRSLLSTVYSDKVRAFMCFPLGLCLRHRCSLYATARPVPTGAATHVRRNEPPNGGLKFLRWPAREASSCGVIVFGTEMDGGRGGDA